MRQDEFGPISEQEVSEAISTCEVIESYPEDKPYPSALLFGRTAGGRPLHVVCAYCAEEDRAVVVTVYHPDSKRWEEDYRRRKR